MEINDFQSACLSTRTETCENIDYPVHEIIEETAELYDKFYNSLSEEQRSDIQIRTIHAAIMHAGKLAKARAKSIRKGEIVSVVDHSGTYDERREMAYEAFDILWGVAAFSDSIGFSLSVVSDNGLKKLADRYQRNKIVGDGDHR